MPENFSAVVVQFGNVHAEFSFLFEFSNGYYEQHAMNIYII